MALDFPASPTLNQRYLNWTFDGTRWVVAQDPRAPFVSRAGDTMGGALEVTFGTPPGDDDATNKKYVDDAIASGALYQGTWVALTNVPDLSGTAHQNGWAWVVITSDPHVNEATGVAIPGLPAGTMVGNGDRIVWNAGTSEFELIHSPGMTQTEADDRYLQLAGGTMRAVTGVAGGGTGITIANSSATATDTAITLTNSGAGAAISLDNTGAYGVWLDNTTAAGRGIVLRNLGGGMGFHINQTTAGLSNVPNSGFTFMSTGAAAGVAFAAWRNVTDTTARWTVRGDGSQLTSYDGAATAVDISVSGTGGPALRVAGAGAGARIEVGTPTGAPPGFGSVNISGSYCINSIPTVLLQRGDLPVGDPLGQTATYRNIVGDGRFPVNFGAGAKLRSGQMGEYSLHLYTNGFRYWFGMTGDGGPPSFGMWQEVGLRNAVVLGDGTDLNTVITPGTYGVFIFDDAAAPTIYNMPVTPNWAFVLEVLGNAGSRVTQRFTVISHVNNPAGQRTFIRGRVDVQPWSQWQEFALYGQLQPQPWYYTRAGGYTWYAPLDGYYNLIAAGPGGGGCNWVGSGGSASRYWCGGSGGVAGRRLYLQTGDILYITVPRGGYPAGGTGAQGAANFGPITEAGGNFQSAVINSPNYDSPGMPPGWLGARSLWIVAQFGLSGWNDYANPAYVESGSGITAFPGYPPSATGNIPGQPRGMSLGSGTRNIIAQSGRGGSYMEAGGDGMAAISYDGP